MRTRDKGFIAQESGKDLFVHVSENQDTGTGYRTLSEGDQVEFTLGISPKGPQPTNVVKPQFPASHAGSRFDAIIHAK